MKPGYKQTEIGMIPEDWEVGSLKQAFPRLDAGVSVNSDDSESSDYYILKTSAVRNGSVNIKEAKPVIRSDYARLKCPVKKGSIIISRMNTPAMVGECGFSTNDAPNTFLPDRLWQIEPSSPDYDFQWLNYLLNTEKYSTTIRATATGTSNSMKNIAKERLLEIGIPKPTIPEQHRIAEALSDFDELIASLEKLIEKKKAIKQGAMQELLTGKRRLPGFSGEWKTYKLGEALSVKHGKAQQEIETPVGKYPILATSGTIGRTNAYLCNLPSVLIGRKGTIDKPQYMDTPFWTIDTLFYTLINADFHAKYLYYLFCTIPWNDYNEASGVPSLSASVIESIPAKIPYYNEQLLISNYLTDLDEQIIRLEKKSKKARLIKQGMMQQLLTGKNRLS